jgi:hypothetical protein
MVGYNDVVPTALITRSFDDMHLRSGAGTAPLQQFLHYVGITVCHDARNYVTRFGIKSRGDIFQSYRLDIYNCAVDGVATWTSPDTIVEKLFPAP